MTARLAPLDIDAVREALALPPGAFRSDFDLNPEIRAEQLQIHESRPAAVLCGLVPQSSGLEVILTVRAGHLRRHAGQIAFPGGRVDPTDQDGIAAALREADEEVGLPSDAVDVLGTLDPYLTSTGFRVTPVVGLIDPRWSARPDPSEVADVFAPPLDFLMNPANRVRHHHDRNGYRRHFYAMPWGGHYIWGATAGILKGFSDRFLALDRGAA